MTSGRRNHKRGLYMVEEYTGVVEAGQGWRMKDTVLYMVPLFLVVGYLYPLYGFSY